MSLSFVQVFNFSAEFVWVRHRCTDWQVAGQTREADDARLFNGSHEAQTDRMATWDKKSFGWDGRCNRIYSNYKNCCHFLFIFFSSSRANEGGAGNVAGSRLVDARHCLSTLWFVWFIFISLFYSPSNKDKKKASSSFFFFTKTLLPPSLSVVIAMIII